MDNKYMKIALNEALKGIGGANPNPLVGAVVVKNDKILSLGFHKKYGEKHAEVDAISKLNIEALEGSTLYVTLEPCSHYGKTPPCVELIIKSKIKRCVIGTLDPNPLVAGKGVEQLKKAGIEVEIGVLEEECKKINLIFFKYITKKIPYVFLKCGITLDGKIATRNYLSKWITNEKSREKVQRYRELFSAIVVGANTILKDNSSLKTRIVGKRDPYRIIFDRNLTIPEDCNVISKNEDKKTILITLKKYKDSEKFRIFSSKYSVSFIMIDETTKLIEILEMIGKCGIDSLLVEGGSNILTQFFETKLYDGGEIFIAPKIIGDSSAISFVNGFKTIDMSDIISLENVDFNIYGDNIGVRFFKEDKLCLLD